MPRKIGAGGRIQEVAGVSVTVRLYCPHSAVIATERRCARASRSRHAPLVPASSHGFGRCRRRRVGLPLFRPARRLPPLRSAHEAPHGRIRFLPRWIAGSLRRPCRFGADRLVASFGPLLAQVFPHPEPSPAAGKKGSLLACSAAFPPVWKAFPGRRFRKKTPPRLLPR